MHVLMLSWEYPPHLVGGMGQHVVDLLPALARAPDVRVTLFTPALQGGVRHSVIAPRMQVVRVPIAQRASADAPPAPADPATVSRVNETLTAHALRWHAHTPFDLIHNHDWMTAQTARAVQQQRALPLLTTIHATERGRWQGALSSRASCQIDAIERDLVLGAQQVIVCSHYMAWQLHDYFGLPAERPTVIPNAVYLRPSPFVNTADARNFRRRYATDNEQLVFFIGRLVYEKGVHVLLDAWQRVAAQRPARLVIAGGGPQATALAAHAAALGLGERVQLVGRISDDTRDRLYRVADAAVFPSLYEPFGIVALEAMAHGCPVVVTRTGGLQGIVQAHETGILVEPGNTDSLAWGILHTLEHPQWARERARNALHAIVQHYTWAQVARQHAAVYGQAATVLPPLSLLQPVVAG